MPANAAATAGPSVTSSVKAWQPCGTGVRPRDTPVTCQPCASRWVASWLPITPLAPMINAFIIVLFLLKRKRHDRCESDSYLRYYFTLFVNKILQSCFHPIT